jgi:hypothetical protein
MNFKDIVDIIFYKKRDWTLVEDKDKESVFFIFNRYMAKKYPKQAQFFNKRDVDKSTAMDIWFQFLQKETSVPFWFWKGSTKKKIPKIDNYELLQDFYKMNINDIYFLYQMFPKETKEEIKRLLQITKVK